MSVITTPRLFVTGAECGALSAEPEPEPPLDNFGESPSFGILHATRGIQALQLTECLKETRILLALRISGRSL